MAPGRSPSPTVQRWRGPSGCGKSTFLRCVNRINDLIDELVEDYTVIIVTHNMQQAARISDQTAVFLTGGELVEFDDTNKIFENPDDARVEDYITGKFG